MLRVGKSSAGSARRVMGGTVGRRATGMWQQRGLGLKGVVVLQAAVLCSACGNTSLPYVWQGNGEGTARERLVWVSPT